MHPATETQTQLAADPEGSRHHCKQTSNSCTIIHVLCSYFCPGHLGLYRQHN